MLNSIGDRVEEVSHHQSGDKRKENVREVIQKEHKAPGDPGKKSQLHHSVKNEGAVVRNHDSSLGSTNYVVGEVGILICIIYIIYTTNPPVCKDADS